MKLAISEAQLEKCGTDLLELDGWRSLKTDPQSERGFAKRVEAKLRAHPQLCSFVLMIMAVLRSCMRASGFGEVGMADRLYLRYSYHDVLLATRGYTNARLRAEGCDIMWIEWKRPGGCATDAQRLWIANEQDRGALVLLAGEDFEATPEGFLAWYRGSGLMRRAIQ